jgi:CheY-like chemotaxis protein
MTPEILEIIPSILWFLLVLGIIVLFYKPIKEELLPNLSGIKAMGVEMSFIKKSINAAVTLAKKDPKWNVRVPDEDKEIVLERARRNINTLRNSRILWIDDVPENNRNEKKMFRKLRVSVEIAKSTDGALGKLKDDEYDVILSDMERDNDSTAGLTFLQKFRKIDKTTPVIFYVGVFDPGKGVPPEAFGITNRPDELLHLTIDALERMK